MASVEPLSEFLKRTADAAAEPLLAKLRQAAARLGLADVDAPAELARMRSFIARYYDGVHPLSSTMTDDGHIIDCVPVDQQPSARSARASGHKPLAMAPPPAPVPGSGADHARDSTAPKSKGPCPAGTVPLSRITLEHLVSFGTLENYFRKFPGAGSH